MRAHHDLYSKILAHTISQVAQELGQGSFWTQRTCLFKKVGGFQVRFQLFCDIVNGAFHVWIKHTLHFDANSHCQII